MAMIDELIVKDIPIEEDETCEEHCVLIEKIQEFHEEEAGDTVVKKQIGVDDRLLLSLMMMMMRTLENVEVLDVLMVVRHSFSFF